MLNFWWAWVILLNKVLIHVWLRLSDLLWYNCIAILATLKIADATRALKLRIIVSACRHAVAVFIRQVRLSWWLHVPGSHPRHLVPFVTGDFWLINAELTEIAFKIGIVLQSHNRILVFHDLLAHVGTVLLVSIHLLVWLVYIGLSTFSMVAWRLLLLHHATFAITTILVELHWNWLSIIMICEHLMGWTTTRHVLSTWYSLIWRLWHQVSFILLQMNYWKPATNVASTLSAATHHSSFAAAGTAAHRWRWHITDQVMTLSGGWSRWWLKITIWCLVCLGCLTYLRGQAKFLLLILTINTAAKSAHAIIAAIVLLRVVVVEWWWVVWLVTRLGHLITLVEQGLVLLLVAGRARGTYLAILWGMCTILRMLCKSLVLEHVRVPAARHAAIAILLLLLLRSLASIHFFISMIYLFNFWVK